MTGGAMNDETRQIADRNYREGYKTGAIDAAMWCAIVVIICALVR